MTDPRDESDAEREAGFLQRWSRRKAATSEPASPPEPAAGDDCAIARTDDAPEAPTKTDDDMPPLDSLDETSDVSGFFSSGVSENLRREALRRVFRLACYQHRDGLDDYDEDYRSFLPLGDTVTADMRYHRERLAARAKSLVDGDESASAQASLPETPIEPDPGTPAEPPPEDDSDSEREKG